MCPEKKCLGLKTIVGSQKKKKKRLVTNFVGDCVQLVS